MELTRRDALSVLVSSGVLVGAGAASLVHDPATDTDESPVRPATLDALVDLASLLYPSAVTGVDAFVRTVEGERLARDAERREGVRAALETLADYAVIRFGTDYDALDADRRDRLLAALGVPSADPAPDGTDAERVRFYLVNELLFTLYTSPTGAELVGIENPQGYPGGTASYQQGPDDGQRGPDA